MIDKDVIWIVLDTFYEYMIMLLGTVMLCIRPCSQR